MSPAPGVRWFGRVGIVAVALAVLSVVGTQYARIIGRNLALAHELGAAQRDVVSLQAKRVREERTIRRLSDPAGAIPEIHDELRLVGDGESIIYLKRRSGTPR